MNAMRLILEPEREEGGFIERAARLEGLGETERLWWRLPAEWRSAATPHADPFVVGMLFPMMLRGGDVHIEGPVSPSLLENLETFMAIWRSWSPEKYRPVRMLAQDEVETRALNPDQCVVPFSCGVDSTFTTYRHVRGLVGRRPQKIGAGVVMNGFDIWRDQPGAAQMYATVLASGQKMLGSLGVPCVPMTSNFHELKTVWGHSFGTHLVSGLMLLSGRFGGMMVPNSMPYAQLQKPWGSTPLSDPHLGGAGFTVRDDGGEASRIEKIKLISQWPEAMENLRVCFNNPGNASNCCLCEKCTRTILAFRIAAHGHGHLPPAFAHDADNRQIRRTRFLIAVSMDLWNELLEEAARAGLENELWVAAIRQALARGKRRQVIASLKKPFLPLRNTIRKLLRGSEKSRRELLQSPKTKPRA